MEQIDDTPTLVYTLNVSSLSTKDSFRIQSGDKIYSYTLSQAGNVEGLESNGNYRLTTNDEKPMVLSQSLVNVTFKVTPDATDDTIIYLDLIGTPSDNVKEITIHLGNDKTMQSGSVDHQDQKIHIDVVDTNTGALIFVKSPVDDTTGKPKQVYHKITMVDAQNVNRRAAAPADYTAATFNEDYQAHQVALPVGSGTVSLAYEGNENNPTDYDFVVVKNDPLGVEGVEAEEGEAEYFTLQGVKVANPEKGIYIKVVGGKAVKVVR